MTRYRLRRTARWAAGLSLVGLFTLTFLSGAAVAVGPPSSAPAARSAVVSALAPSAGVSRAGGPDLDVYDRPARMSTRKELAVAVVGTLGLVGLIVASFWQRGAGAGSGRPVRRSRRLRAPGAGSH